MAIADDYAAIAAAMQKHAEPQEEQPDDIIDLIELATWAWLAVGDPYAHKQEESI